MGRMAYSLCAVEPTTVSGRRSRRKQGGKASDRLGEDILSKLREGVRLGTSRGDREGIANLSMQVAERFGTRPLVNAQPGGLGTAKLCDPSQGV